MTDQASLEKEIAELSVQLVQAKYSVEEALIYQQWKRKVKLLIKARRDAKVNKHNL